MVKYAFREGGVWRLAGSRTVEALPGAISSKMEKDSRQFVTAWRWEVELKSRQDVARIKPLFTFQAATPEVKR